MEESRARRPRGGSRTSGQRGRARRGGHGAGTLRGEGRGARGRSAAAQEQRPGVTGGAGELRLSRCQPAPPRRGSRAALPLPPPKAVPSEASPSRPAGRAAGAWLWRGAAVPPRRVGAPRPGPSAARLRARAEGGHGEGEAAAEAASTRPPRPRALLRSVGTFAHGGAAGGCPRASILVKGEGNRDALVDTNQPWSELGGKK